jgi:O-antigen/teichoic acid export membrane protein
MAALQLFPNIVFKYILPYDATGQSNKKIKLFTILISVVISISGIILAPIIIPEFLPKYVESINAVQIMSVVVIPTSITFIITSKLLGMENSRHVLISRLIGLIIICPGMIVLGMMFEIIGVAVAYVVANTASSISLVISNYVLNTKTHQN